MNWRNPDFSHLPIKIHRWKSIKWERIELRSDHVTVTEWSAFGKQTWVEPVSAFKCLLYRTDVKIRGHGNYFDHSGFSIVIVHLLEMVHSEQDKTLLLYKGSDQRIKPEALNTPGGRIQKMWKDAARSLNLPALAQSPTNE